MRKLKGVKEIKNSQATRKGNGNNQHQDRGKKVTGGRTV